MSVILKVDADGQSFINGLSSGGRASDKSVSISLARALAYSLPLEEVGDISEVANIYRVKCRMVVENKLSALNEILPLDVNTILAYVEKFYGYRMEQCFSNTPVLALKPETAVADFFKISKYFDQDMLSVISADPVYITGLSNNFINLIKQL